MRKKAGFSLLGAVFSLISMVCVFGGGMLQAEMPQEKIQKGEKIYIDRNCKACHRILGDGGKVGPDLSDVGRRRDEAWLKGFLPDPKSAFPGTIMPPFRGSEEELDALVAYLSSLR